MNHKDNISSNISTLLKLSNFNTGGVISICDSNSLIYRDIDNAKGGLCIRSGMIRLIAFMFISIIILTSYNVLIVWIALICQDDRRLLPKFNLNNDEYFM